MAQIKTGPSKTGLQLLAVPAVCVLVTFLGYYSQWLFNSSTPVLGPGPPTTNETVLFNTLLACLWWTYYKACTTDPGRYTFPSEPTQPDAAPNRASTTTKWCKKCDAPKPLRAHHCRHCSRCIPRMDHHCPWTGNCVSMQTFPHFLRFLVFTNISLWALGWLLFARIYTVWSDRHLPAYLGPTLLQLISLTVLTLVGAATSLALGILLFTTAKGWVLNTTMIEDWEIERHEASLERSSDDYWAGSGSAQQPPEPVEFPYDLGFWSNMSQAMGTSNPLLWIFPFSGSPVIDPSGRGAGWDWEENGFNDRPGMWPPRTAEKLGRPVSGWPGAASRTAADRSVDERDREYATPEAARAAFARRQHEDLLRRQEQRSGIIAELEEVDDLYEIDGYADDYDQGVSGNKNGYTVRPEWRNAEGDTLHDYGVDEEVEAEVISIGSDEDVPLAELIRRRRATQMEEDI